MGILKNQKGQSLIEYVILVALVGAATIGMVRILQQTIKVNMANVVHTLQSDHKYREEFVRVENKDIKKSDFSDFMNGAANR